MSFLDRLLGRRQDEPTVRPNTLRSQGRLNEPSVRAASADPDALAVERYRYLLRTAPPDQLEAAHAEAFGRLTPEQRAVVRRELQAAVGPAEGPQSDDPRDLARAATRAEVRAPGTLERSFADRPGMPGMAGSFLETFAAVFIATSVAQALFGGFGDPGMVGAASGEAGLEDPDAESDWGGEAGEGMGGFEEPLDGGGFGDLGGDVGDFGGFDI